MKLARAEWVAQLGSLDVSRLVFLDESSVCTGLTRNRGWSVRGQPAFIQRKVRSERVSVIGAMGLDGLRGSMCIEGTVDGDVFLEYLRQFLVPTLRPGDVVVMDNLSVHKVPGVREVLAEAGAKPLYLPPYSPDFNPIEMLWSWAKASLRDVAARSIDAVIRLLGEAMRRLPTEYVAAWFRHCGYPAAVGST